ncbi:diaminobutyrate--2-oxoglutarate transaminase [Wenjunlia tyrosinilytica]|uniref:Diaminobutyrate--2-oxoglutarate transaminase n=1 Tax=Wenjunlia tyrosinilytica TaxID=1544741 RepID=A0A917ZWA8_9ACTN|nr:diaminobutyrate--2-oxoglutarate transaminase [Wenjunlia tyrosinilytica]GGO93665.1 diaminobutyrate--2-oxoglutarate transaminase [Wenjunlia tyrosinilytica]
MSVIDETVFEAAESAVRSYSRSFPALFSTAKGDCLSTADGRYYIDFLAGAGSLNYGHNPDSIKRALIDYLGGDGLVHGLDLATSAKADFLDAFREHILRPRGLGYKVQFTSPSGTNAVEAALKLARLATGRSTVIAFSGGFHGVSTGSLAATASGYFRQGLHQTLPFVTHIPYPQTPLGDFDSLDLLRRLLEDPSSGVDKPAAVLLETVQGEGGVYAAPIPFLKQLRALCDRHRILLIVDDIQAGCGRTGTFFSFEPAGIEPDMVTLAKSIGGYGLPMAVLLMKPELDVWQPGQHNGTFRGNQLAFVAAATAIRHYWSDDAFAAKVRKKGELVADFLQRRVTGPLGIPVRGRGLMWGIDLSDVPGVTAGKVSRLCFEKGLVIESCGRGSEVLKLLPPLTISQVNLSLGLDTVAASLSELAGDGTIQS